MDLGYRPAHNRTVQTKSKHRQIRIQQLHVAVASRHVVERFLHNPSERTGKPTTTASAAAKEFIEAILETAQTILREETRILRTPEWCEIPDTRVPTVETALAQRREAG